MKKLVLLLVLALPMWNQIHAQNPEYYKTIQKSSTTQIDPKQFKKIESNALKSFARPDAYSELASAFAGTTEKVWGVIYGEVFCNLTADADRSKQIGALVYELYAKSITNSSTGHMTVSLTENAEAPKNQVPFESQFEIAFLMGTAPIAGDGSPLTIKKLAEIRKNQLDLWKEKGLPQNDLLRRLQNVISAGHIEAYNFWLFQAARPDEFKEWLGSHQAQYDSWLAWQGANKFVVERPDFQRLYLLQQ